MKTWGVSTAAFLRALKDLGPMTRDQLCRECGVNPEPAGCVA